MNGGPQHPFTPAGSLYVNCTTQEEVDELWTKLTEGGKPGPCGWQEDRYGLSWQIIPDAVPDSSRRGAPCRRCSGCRRSTSPDFGPQLPVRDLQIGAIEQ